jgi:hypothetical protein
LETIGYYSFAIEGINKIIREIGFDFNENYNELTIAPAALVEIKAGNSCELI